MKTLEEYKQDYALLIQQARKLDEQRNMLIAEGYRLQGIIREFERDKKPVNPVKPAIPSIPKNPFLTKKPKKNL